MTSGNMILITTEDSAALLNTVDRAVVYTHGMLEQMLEKGVPVSINIQSRSASQCELFLAGTKPMAAVQAGAGAPSHVYKAKKAAMSKKSTPKKQTDQEPAKNNPAGDVFESISETTMAVCNAICRGAHTMADIRAVVGKCNTAINFQISKLVKSGLVRIEGKGAGTKYYDAKLSAGSISIGENIFCRAKSKKILRADCHPNDASPMCRGCDHFLD